MNFLANILNGINKKDKNEMTVEKAVQIFKNNKEKFEEFEEFYKKKGIYKEVDGTKPMNKVFEDICAILG